MHFLFFLLFLIVLFYGPSLWVNLVMSRHRQQDAFDFTGAELANRLVRELELENVQVEVTDQGDHYDPAAQKVRLHGLNYDGRSLTAIAVAAHEVGHALQHARGERPFIMRQKWVLWSMKIQRLGSFVMMAVPLLALVTRHPAPPLIMFLLGLASIGSAAVVHLMTLPVELDASFNKALPLLQERQLLSPKQERGARRILKAAAYTYVAGSLAGLLNVWRWFRLLRR